MEISLVLNLPRDELSVPVARRIVDSSMRTVGVAPTCVDDVSLALTEACTNVLKHSGPGEEYEVCVRVRDETCTIEIRDIGRGFDPTTVPEGHAALDAERGRGVQLMKMLVDRVRFESKEAAGAVVSMDKRLEYVDGSLLDRAVAGS